ncbi:hypothetical protein ACIOEX_20940 [Streptomyces sp. NPDC087850]|uniref:hypothetical protein n=1 Tax=unclassified Streptomyces TaxID=2593676 RepID=UPI00380F0D19
MSRIRTFMHRVAVGAVAAGVLAVGAMAAPAGAQAAPEEARQTYAAQTLRAGLTADQAGELQGRVDRYLARLEGGEQVSANRIALPGGDLTVAAPGQPSARDLASPAASGRLPAACARGYLCLTRGGDRMDLYRCGTYSMPWTGDGTFENNQSSGTRARFLNSDRSVRYITDPAYSQGTVTWTPIYYVVPC